MNTQRLALSELFNDPFFASLGIQSALGSRPAERRGHLGQRRRVTDQVPVSVTRNAESISVSCDLPGVKIDDLSLVLDGDELQISAKRELACAGGLASGANKEQGDTTVRSYSTTFKLGEDIDVEKITAQLDAGVLTVQLPLVVAKQPRRIEIKAA